MKAFALALFVFAAVPASADPIIVGPDGYIAYEDITFGLEWQSNQHLRVTFWHDPSPGDAPTTYEAQQRISETVLGDVFWYFLPLAGIDPCGHSQFDLEWEPGAGNHGVIDTLLWCQSSKPAPPVPTEPPSIGQPEPPPSAPEPPSVTPPPMLPEPPSIPDEPTIPTDPLPSPVPEPNPLALVVSGLVILAVANILRRRK